MELQLFQFNYLSEFPKRGTERIKVSPQLRDVIIGLDIIANYLHEIKNGSQNKGDLDKSRNSFRYFM